MPDKDTTMEERLKEVTLKHWHSGAGEIISWGDYYQDLKAFIASEKERSRREEAELAIKRLEACLMGTYDVVNLGVDPPTKHITTIKEIREHIQMHIDLAREALSTTEEERSV